MLHTNAAKLNAPPVRVFSKRSRQPPSVALVARAVWLSTRMTEDRSSDSLEEPVSGGR